MKMNKLVYVSLLATAFTITSCVQKGDRHNVTLSATHGTWSGDKYAYQNVDYTATFAPEEGYALKEENIIVQFDNTRVYGCYTFSDNVLTISKDYLATAVGDIEIKAFPYLISYRADIRIGNVSPKYESPRYHKQFNATFTAKPHYRLPDKLNVSVGGNRLTAGVQYTYDLKEERLSILPEYVDGDILITGDGVKLAELTFYGEGGLWDKEDPKKVVEADVGAKFSTVASLAGTPKFTDNSRTFDHWAFYDDPSETKVNDDYPIKDGDKFKAIYVTSQFTVRVFDTSSCFPEDLYKDLVPYHGAFKIPLKIEGELAKSHQLPSSISVTCETDTGQQPIEFSYRRDTDFEGEISVDTGKVIGDVQIKFTTPTVANITFKVGDGYWNAERTEADDTTVSLVTDRTYTLLEAWRFAQRELGVTNDPISKDSGKVFVGWKNEEGTIISNINAEISSSCELTAVYEERTFENDTWENVVLAANAGLDFLYDFYNTNESKILASTRKIVIGNSELGYSQQTVRLIGIAQDTLANSKNDEKAALTFEFTNTFYEMSFGDNRFYQDSTIRRVLNSDLVKSIPVFNELKDKTPTIREVVKQTYNFDVGKSEGSIVETNDSCFLLSANEMGLTGPDMPHKEPVVGEEGPVYQYYANATSDRRVKGSSPFVDTSNYWLRSENYQTAFGTQNVYAINDTGKVYDISTLDSIGVAPAFAIGTEKHGSHTGNIAATDCECISHPSTFTVVDNEMGFVSDIVFKANEGKTFKPLVSGQTNDVSISVTPGGSGASAEIKQIYMSDDCKTVRCTITYNSEAADPKNTITLSAQPSLDGYSGTINLSSCTSASGVTGFQVLANQAGTFTDTFTATTGYLFTGDVSKDVTFEVIGSGGIKVNSSKYSENNTVLALTIAYDEKAAMGDIVVNVGANTRGYLGKVECTNCSITTGSSSFVVEYGHAATDVADITVDSSGGDYYFNTKDLQKTFDYKCEAMGGAVEFKVKDISSDHKTMTFTFSYNEAASYGAINIGVIATAPYSISFELTGVYSDGMDPIQIVPGTSGTTSEITARAIKDQKRDKYYYFVEPFINNFTTISEGSVTINIVSANADQIVFTISYDESASCNNLVVRISALLQ